MIFSLLLAGAALSLPVREEKGEEFAQAYDCIAGIEAQRYETAFSREPDNYLYVWSIMLFNVDKDTNANAFGWVVTTSPQSACERAFLDTGKKYPAGTNFMVMSAQVISVSDAGLRKGLKH